MEDRTYKQVIAIILSAIIAGIAVYGSYMPMRKAEMFIGALQSLQSNPASSLSDLEQRVSVPLDYPSPVGQEELVRNMANSVLSFIQQGADPTSTAQLISFLNTYYDPILARGKGMSFSQDLYLEGAVNEVAFAVTGNRNYLSTAQQYYGEGVALGPNRPQSLYGLFDIYRAEGNIKNTLAIGERILANWPSDTRVVAALQALTPTSTKKTSK